MKKKHKEKSHKLGGCLLEFKSKAQLCNAINYIIIIII